MQLIRTIPQIRKVIARAKVAGKTVGFVPTMGGLHEGHLSLLRRSKKENNISVLSIFVNPKQFGPDEDFKAYPRNFKKDELLAKKEKVDIIFYPSEQEMYQKDNSTAVEVKGMDQVLCGPFRPGHFKGVTTVVAKLLNIITPDTLYLGQKDAQQAAIIAKMIKDLNWSTHIKILPTIREKNGLAMSSRNIYLTSQEKQKASILYRTLVHAKKKISNGERHASAIIRLMRAIIQQQGVKKIDYIECVESQTLEPLKLLKGNVLIALAVWIGRARLIDNITVRVK